jgi:hypothetical protein
MSPKSTLGKFAASLAGGPIPTGSRFSFSSHVGRIGSLVVEPLDNGGSRVAMFLPDLPQQAYVQPQQQQAAAQQSVAAPQPTIGIERF